MNYGRNQKEFKLGRKTAADQPCGGGDRGHTDTTAAWFLLSSMAYFFIVGIIAIVIAAKFVWPEMLGTVSIFTYGRLRPLHVNGMLFGWLLAADMGLVYYVDAPPLRCEALE